jgi:hypothetical protein
MDLDSGRDSVSDCAVNLIINLNILTTDPERRYAGSTDVRSGCAAFSSCRFRYLPTQQQHGFSLATCAHVVREYCRPSPVPAAHLYMCTVKRGQAMAELVAREDFN